MLASVRGPAEARCALDAGVDIIDLKEPDRGALGAVDPATAAQVVRLVGGRTCVSATVGDLPYRESHVGPAAARTAATGVDLIKVGVFGDVRDEPVLRCLGSLARGGCRIVLVLFAEQAPARIDFMRLSAAGIAGVMLDTGDKSSGSLLRKLSIRMLSEFVRGARAAGLLTGLAGSLRAPDIAPLLAIGPDYLGFRGALCIDGERGAKLDAGALIRVKSLVTSGHPQARGVARCNPAGSMRT